MPVGVLGQSDGTDPAEPGEPRKEVTNACRRFGSVGPSSCVGLLNKRRWRSPMPVGVLGQSDSGEGAGNCRGGYRVTNACRRFGSVGQP